MPPGPQLQPPGAQPQAPLAHTPHAAECWNGPYATASFPLFAEPIPPEAEGVDKARSPSLAMLLEVARDCGVLLVGGSIPEASGGKFYNTCVVVRPDGRVAALHRKVHLFDIHVPGGISFRESDTLSAGDSLTLVDTSWGFSLGLGICYDIRFPEMAMVLRARGAKLLLFPGAFNLTTGPAHWELLQRARAVDNQVTGNGRGKGRAGVRLREASDREMPPATD